MNDRTVFGEQTGIQSKKAFRFKAGGSFFIKKETANAASLFFVQLREYLR